MHTYLKKATVTTLACAIQGILNIYIYIYIYIDIYTQYVIFLYTKTYTLVAQVAIEL